MRRIDKEKQGKRRWTVRQRRAAIRRSRTLRRRHALRWPYPSTYVPGNLVEVYYEGASCYSAMLQAIRNADRAVHMETYLLRSDAMGWTFARALAERAEAGVECALMYDSVGGMPVASDYLAFLRDAGVLVLEYHPIWPWLWPMRGPYSLNRRNHRKILAVDGQVAFVGGMNISDHAMPKKQGGEGWFDVHLRIEGPAALGLNRLFIEEWVRQGGDELSSPEIAPANPEGVPVRIVENGRHHRRAMVRAAYMDSLVHARERIWIMNGYFAPDRRFVRALMRAGRRGVDVRVIVPGQSDINVIMWAGQHLYERLLAAGVRLYEWNASVLHAKVAVVDGKWLTIGTYNLDHRSLRYNLEVNAMVLARETASAVERTLAQAAESCRPLRLEKWKARSRLARLRSWLCYLFRSWL